MDIVEPVVFGECKQFRGRCGCLISYSSVLEFLKLAISFEMSRGSSVTVATVVLGATGLSVVGTVAGVAFSLVNSGKGRSYWESVRELSTVIRKVEILDNLEQKQREPKAKLNSKVGIFYPHLTLIYYGACDRLSNNS